MSFQIPTLGTIFSQNSMVVRPREMSLGDSNLKYLRSQISELLEPWYHKCIPKKDETSARWITEMMDSPIRFLCEATPTSTSPKIVTWLLRIFPGVWAPNEDCQHQPWASWGMRTAKVSMESSSAENFSQMTCGSNHRSDTSSRVSCMIWLSCWGNTCSLQILNVAVS